MGRRSIADGDAEIDEVRKAVSRSILAGGSASLLDGLARSDDTGA